MVIYINFTKNILSVFYLSSILICPKLPAFLMLWNLGEDLAYPAFSHAHFAVDHFHSESPFHLKSQIFCPMAANNTKSESEKYLIFSVLLWVSHSFRFQRRQALINSLGCGNSRGTGSSQLVCSLWPTLLPFSCFLVEAWCSKCI